MQHHIPTLAGNAGAAFLLRTPSKNSATIDHSAGQVRLIAGASCLTVELHATVAREAVRDECWRVVQEALDVYAATHREAFATKEGERNFITWRAESDGYELNVVDTVQFLWQFHAEIVDHSQPSKAVPACTPQPVKPHPALRYYRLSQLADDLFDSFRNAYLALEYLVSEVSPKIPSESEQSWLARVLVGPLAQAVPKDIDVVSFVDDVYRLGRLPLFHAKSYTTIYLPQGAERSALVNTFETLQLLLASIQHYRLDTRIARGWASMSDQLNDAGARVAYEVNQLVFQNGPQQAKVETYFEVIDVPRYFGNIWGRTPFLEIPPLTSLERIVLLKDGSDWLCVELPCVVPLAGVSKIQLSVRQSQRSARAPTKLHAS